MHRFRIDNLFHVPRNMCDVCVDALAAAVQALDAAARIEADLETRTVRFVSYAYESALLRSLRKAGFPAEPVVRPLG